MQIQIISDFHLEYIYPNMPLFKSYLEKIKTDADILIIAGDFCQPLQMMHAFNILSKNYKHIVYVAGNHECYGTTPQKFNFVMREVEKKFNNLHYLSNKTVTIDGVRFVGTTLWYSLQTTNPVLKVQYNRLKFNFPDFTQIEDFDKHLVEEHQKAVRWLDNVIKPQDIVITHHTPTYKSVSPRFQNSQLNPFFVNQMDEMIYNHSPKFWIHGHVHNHHDYRLFNTRILCNPLGYMGELGVDFNPRLVIDYN